MADRVDVRMLVDLGGHKAGDVIALADKPLNPGHVQPDGPTTLIEAYVAAGYVVRL